MASSHFEAKNEVKAEPSRTTEETIDLICALAKAKDKDALEKLIKSDVSINNQMLFLFNEAGSVIEGKWPAVKIITAEEPVDIEALELLISLGASLDEAVSGAASNSNVALVENLLSRGARLSCAIVGAAYANQSDLVKNLLSRKDASIKDKTSVAYCAAIEGHVTLMENVLRDDDGASLNSAARGALLRLFFADDTRAFNFCAAIKDYDLQIKFVAAVEELAKLYANYFFTIDKNKLLSRLKAFKDLNQKKQMNVNQFLAWECEEFKGVMALSQRREYLPRDLLFIVAAFLAPSSISGMEIQNLFLKMPLDIRKVDLAMSFGRLQNQRPDRLKFFQEAKSEKELDQSILDEIHSLTQRDSYFDLLQSHSASQVVSPVAKSKENVEEDMMDEMQRLSLKRKRSF